MSCISMDFFRFIVFEICLKYCILKVFNFHEIGKLLVIIPLNIYSHSFFLLFWKANNMNITPFVTAHNFLKLYQFSSVYFLLLRSGDNF